jgi:hypothetical protein
MQKFSSGRGYIAAQLGGLAGALPLLALGVAIGQAIATRTQDDAAIVFGGMFGASLGEVLGCWSALRWGNYRLANRTARILIGLLVPGWFLFIGLSLLTGAGSAIALFMLMALPVIARVLTHDPQFPDYLYRTMHTYAKRPWSR